MQDGHHYKKKITGLYVFFMCGIFATVTKGWTIKV